MQILGERKMVWIDYDEKGCPKQDQDVHAETDTPEREKEQWLQ